MSQTEAEKIQSNVQKLISAYKLGRLGNMTMPEDAHPDLSLLSKEEVLIYYTLPMSLNYQRNSYKLWEATTKAYSDTETKDVFCLKNVSMMSFDDLSRKLLRYKVALQPVRHTQNWKTIGTAIYNNWRGITELLESTDYDFLKLQQLIQSEYKKSFPYLSGPKIFHYWCYVLERYCDVKFTNSDKIEIAPDTHVIQSSVKLGVITEEETETLSREAISSRWRTILSDTGIRPIDVHSPLWFWSRNKFKFEV